MRQVAALAIAVLVAGCTKRNPAYCESSTDCTADSARPFCDVDGAFEGNANTCIPRPEDAPDAGPPLGDGAPFDAGCVAMTCSALGAECGAIDDGCGEQLDCGGCPLPESCGGGGEDNVCGCAETVWFTEEIDPGTPVGTAASIALDADGVPQVSFYRRFPADLVHGSRAIGGGWIRTVVDSPGNVGEYSSLAVAPDGTIHLSYSDTTGDVLKHAAKSPGGSWTSETLVAGGLHNSIAVDSTGDVHIVHTVSNSIAYAHRSGETWSFESVDASGNAAEYGSIGIDSTQEAHVSYARLDGAADFDLEYARRPIGENWSHAIVTAGIDEDWTSLAVDETDGIHVVARDVGAASGIAYAYKPAGGTWTSELIDTTEAVNPGGNRIVAVDAAGTIHVTHGRKYAYRPIGGDWTIEMFESEATAGRISSLAVEAEGAVHIVYSVGATGDQQLRYAYRCP